MIEWVFDDSPDQQELDKDEKALMEQVVAWVIHYVENKQMYDSMIEKSRQLA